MSRLIALVLFVLLTACTAGSDASTTILSRQADEVVELLDYEEGFEIQVRKGETRTTLLRSGICRNVSVQATAHEVVVLYDDIELTYANTFESDDSSNYSLILCYRGSSICQTETRSVQVVGCP